MRADIVKALVVKVVTLYAFGALFVAPVCAAPPAQPPAKLAPADIQSTFFDGKPFVASSPSNNVRFRMTFTPDGKIKRVPMGKGSRGEGSWKLSKDGFCRAWSGAKEECFTVVSAGDRKWSVMHGTTPAATWSK
jgi:hypothetical protein